MSACQPIEYRDLDRDSPNCDQQAGADPQRLFMPPSEGVLVARFEIPAESMFRRRPEHEIQHALTRHRVRSYTEFPGMNPLRTGSEHELYLLRKGPWLLEQKVGIPLCRVLAEKRRYAGLQLQPVLDGSYFHCRRGSEARSAFEIPSRGAAKLEHRGGLPAGGRDGLREGVSRAEK